MIKKFTITLLTLLFIVFLFTGCSKLEDTTLEGTWRITAMTTEGITIDFPLKVEVPGVSGTIQPYIQLKNGIYTSISKDTITIESTTEVSWEITGEGTYSVDGDTLTTNIEGEEEELTYVISGNKLNITGDGDETMKAVKVPDSDVAEAFEEE